MMDDFASANLDADTLDQLLPMHMLVAPDGDLRHIGPTLRKLAGADIRGLGILDVFDIRRPRDPASTSDLLRAPGGRLQLSLRDGPHTPLKGQAVALADGGLLVNLSLGISVVDAVARHHLTAADFAPTDLTIEMLYLVEAKTAVMRESLRLNARLNEAREQAESRALSDPLTGLGNRRAMDEALVKLVERRERFGLLHLDLDYFKDVNDTLGHAAGDHVLTVVAAILREVTRSRDILARVGGDEFVVLIRDQTDPETLTTLAARLIAALERPIRWNRRCCRISGSVGITTTDHYPRPDPDRMLCDADEALYVSKRSGRALATMVAYPDSEPATERRQRI